MAKLATFGVSMRPQKVLGRVRDVRGRFIKYEWASQAHQDAAYHIARCMHDDLEQKVAARARSRGFASRETRHLRRALVTPGNWAPLRGSNWVFGFRAGIPSHLDSTPAAPYWRNLERGTRIFRGGGVGPSRGRRLLMTPSGPRDLINIENRRSNVVSGEIEGGSRSRFPIAHVLRGIDPYHYMRDGGRKGVDELYVLLPKWYGDYGGPRMK